MTNLNAHFELLTELSAETEIIAFDSQVLLDEYKARKTFIASVPFIITPDFKALAIAGYIEMTMFHISTGMKSFVITEAGRDLLNSVEVEDAPTTAYNPAVMADAHWMIADEWKDVS
ncbi:MAG: hypothetical protein ACPG7F_09630 [Aggregatilineales bacterium]